MKNQRILSGNAVPPAGVIGYDFFANFTLVVDSVGGKMTFIKNRKIYSNKKEG